MSGEVAALPPLPNEAIVIRGGTMPSASLEAQAMAHFEATLQATGREEYAVSVASLPDQGADVIIERAWNAGALPYPIVRRTTAGALRAAHYDVRLTNEDTAHADLIMSSAPSEEHWVRLRSIFGEPEENKFYLASKSTEKGGAT